MQQQNSLPARSPSPGFSGHTPLASGYCTPTGFSTPLLPGRVLDTRRRHKLAVERVNLRRLFYYLSDFFHTLVNCPWYIFYLLFIAFYVTMYCCYALLYISQPGCITKVSTFLHALWFSVQSSATIGYGHQAPNPECYLLQFGIMAQVLTSLLMQASLLGLVFARISNSSGRSATIRFSKVLSMYRGEDGCYRMAFRVANLRQHQVLQPEVRMLLLRRQARFPFSSNGWEYTYTELCCEHMGGGRLWLGIPSVMEHKVDAQSPLYGVSEADMREQELEIVVLLDGIDESTSRALQARHSYIYSDIRWQHQFDSCLMRRRSGKIGVDFALFDATLQACPAGPGPEDHGSSCFTAYHSMNSAANGAVQAGSSASMAAAAAAVAAAAAAVPGADGSGSGGAGGFVQAIGTGTGPAGRLGNSPFQSSTPFAPVPFGPASPHLPHLPA